MKQVIEKISKENPNKWPELFEPVSSDLALVQNNLVNKLSASSKLLSEVVRYIFEAGGKRIRPALSLLTAKSTGGITEKHIILAELTELIHTASLVHDDIIDESKLRRGRETINSLWNDKVSVITGDFLFAEASIRLGELENTTIVKIYAKVLSDLCDGEIDQFASRFNTNITWDYYIQKSNTKTASLFAACCKSAAILNKQSEHVIEQANLFGKYLGIAFQIIDDTLDFTSNAKEIGKEVGSDLSQGTITAPTIYALHSNDERSKQLKLLIESRFTNKDDFNKAINLVFELGGCDKAKQLANDYLDKAKKNLVFVKDSTLKNNLNKIADLLISKV